MGALLVKASYDMQSRKFLEDEFVIRSGFCGSFESHAPLNSSKGMIYCRQLLDCSFEEIKDEQVPASYIDYVRISKKQNPMIIRLTITIQCSLFGAILKYYILSYIFKNTYTFCFNRKCAQNIAYFRLLLRFNFKTLRLIVISQHYRVK